MYDLTIYDEIFFSTNRDEGIRMAEWFIPLLLDLFHFESIVDVGCGTGHYLKKCVDLGIEDVTGIDGSPHAIKHSLLPAVRLVDLRFPFEFQRTRDIAICIEVAEHIEQEYVPNFLTTLCSASDLIVMTAAPPGQGGLQHVNEQTQEFWLDRMNRHGFEIDRLAVKQIRQGIDAAAGQGHHVASWFKPNVMVFRRLHASA